MSPGESPWKLSYVPAWSYAVLLQFFGAGRAKEWPVPRERKSEWRKLLYTLFRQDTYFEPMEFRLWLASWGWPERDISAIWNTLLDDSEALMEFAELIEADQEDPA